LTKPYLISAAVHLLALGALFIIAAPEAVDSDYSEIIRIRIRNQGMNSRFSGKARAASPSESSRSVRKPAGIPQFREFEDSFMAEQSVPSPTYSRKIVATSEPAEVEVTLPDVSDAVKTVSLTAVDPLAGFEDVIPDAVIRDSGSSESWSVTWAGGGGRGIVSVPELSQEDFPKETERLQNIVVSIRVSPRGGVSSAAVIPPGSGDIRIDRQICNAALKIVLEPWPEENGDQEGRLRLVFQEGSR